MEYKGHFVYYKTEKGYYNYRLKASNNETIAVSGGTGYSSLSACKAGIESVRANVNAHIEDQTLAKTEVLTHPKFELYKDKAGNIKYVCAGKECKHTEMIPAKPEDGNED